MRAQGTGRIDGWFAKKHRARGVGAFHSTFDGLAGRLLAEVDQSYTAAMK